MFSAFEVRVQEIAPDFSMSEVRVQTSPALRCAPLLSQVRVLGSEVRVQIAVTLVFRPAPWLLLL